MLTQNRRSFLAASMLAIVAVAFCGPIARAGSHMSDEDKGFLKDAVRNLEIMHQTSMIASDKSESTGVKHYASDAAHATDDMLKELRTMIEKYDLKFDADPNKPDIEQKKALEKLSGHEFDRQYMSNQVDSHKELLEIFKTGAKKAKSDDLKDFFSKKTDAVNDHLEAAQKLSHELKEGDKK